MKSKNKIIWSPQARADLRAIRAYIGRDAPLNAKNYIQRIRASVACAKVAIDKLFRGGFLSSDLFRLLI